MSSSRRSKWWQWLRTQIRDALELVLLPAMAVGMPWPWAFQCFKWLARMEWLYRDATQRALQEARGMGWVDDEKAWCHQRRLNTLVDHADHYLAATRSQRWLARYVQRVGEWPAGGAPAIVITFHWGAGMWSLRDAQGHGLNAHILVAPVEGAHFQGRPVLHWYARSRTAALARELGHPTIDASSSMRPVLQALRQNRQVIAVIDVPSDAVSASLEITLLGQQARMPRGLLRLAVEHRLPVTLFTMGIDYQSGFRTLKLEQLGVHGDTETLAKEVFERLDQSIRRQPPAWHFWSEAPRIFVRRD